MIILYESRCRNVRKGINNETKDHIVNNELPLYIIIYYFKFHTNEIPRAVFFFQANKFPAIPDRVNPLSGPRK